MASLPPRARSLGGVARWDSPRENQGSVVVLEDGQRLPLTAARKCVKLGEITPAQYQAMTRWYPDPGIFIEIETLRSILGEEHFATDDGVNCVYVRRNRDVELLRGGTTVKLARLDETQFSAVCAWHQRVIS